MNKPQTIAQFFKQFPDDEACLRHLFEIRFGPDFACPACERQTKWFRIKAERAYSCQWCGHHLHPTVGTPFQQTRTPLQLWFYAIFLFTTTRNGVAAKELQRQLGVTYKTAWRMAKQIRTLLDEDGGPLQGIVEVDETFVGGKPRQRQPRRGPRPATDPTAKKPVVGMVERGGAVKAWVTDDVRAKTIRPLITEHIMPEATVFTDDAGQYGSGKAARGYQHRRINHSARVYVKGDLHTNTIEGFWSLLKNGIRGTYHAVGKDYLQSYVDEYAFRYNHRNDKRGMFAAFLSQIEKDGPSVAPASS